MENATGGTEAKAKVILQGILNTAIKVITSPVEFFRSMPREGGFQDPLIFMVVLGVASGMVQTVANFIHFGSFVSITVMLGSIVFMPIAVLIGGFIGAAILFVIWKLMGSNESFETAYRCCAYASAISPITCLFGLVPWVGSLIGLAWGLFLVVTASVEVHKIKAKTAWLVFGIITAVLAIMSISSQIAARRMLRHVGEWNREMSSQSGGDMTPEDVNRLAAGAMMNAKTAAMRNECLNNLRMLQSAKEEWATENNKSSGGSVDTKALVKFFKKGKLPACPMGGTYKVNSVGTDPECSIPGHALSEE